ncbi:MAG: apolipoprotein N-acyltransferase [Gemmatimonadetes bacterium]|nr:apolipoprotein N-acyltransferase [Gemmatimonadota bacterium]
MSARALLPTRRELLPAVSTAVLLFVAYPPLGLIAPSFVALVPFLWALEGPASAPGGAGMRAARLGYWTGVCANGLVLYWMVVALWHFTPLSLAGYLASVFVVLAPGWALAAWATERVRRRTGLPLWLVFPLLWTAVEWVAGHLGDLRFPWLGLGTSLVRAPVLVQWADLAGARGVTLWVAWVNVMLFAAHRRRAVKPAALAAATAALALAYGVWRERTLVLRPVTTVAVVQPNVGFEEKRGGRENDSLVLELLALTLKAESLPGVRLVAWPEAAVPAYFYDHPRWERWMGALARETRIPIVAGGLDVEFRADGSYEYYNAAFLFDSAGSSRSQPSYRKRYLVPIVERVPFLNPRWFGNLRWFGGFGHGDRFPVYRIPEGRFGLLICYESAFEDLARRYRQDGADFLINITNDAWFGRTVAPYQHASHLVMRAIETRMGIARAANTGISQFVDPLGRVHGSTPLFVERVEASPVLTTAGRTLYVRLGDWVAALALAGAAVLGVAAAIRGRAPADAASR